MEEEIKELVNKFYKNTQFSLGLIDGEEIRYLGFIKKEKEVQLIKNQDKVFEIGSITKIFTSYILAELILEEKIKLNDRISKYVSINLKEGKRITIEQLANHTSGLPRLPNNFYEHPNYNENNPYKNYDENCLKEYLEEINELKNAPGKVFNYSNLGYGILSYIISKVEDKDFARIIENRIFRPFGMNKSSFGIKEIVEGINQYGHRANNWNGGILNGCIGIVSTIEDLIKYMQEILKEENEISKLQAKESYKIENEYYIGLGWGIRGTEKGKTINHGGGSEGYNSYMKLNREKKKGMVLLTNVSAFHDKRIEIERLSKRIMKLI